GDTIRTVIWQDGPALHFRAEAAERDVVVIDNGIAALIG
ncbi:MAG: hypothetical protein RLZZ136_1649, partial [Pseudomonadota bacterium]